MYTVYIWFWPTLNIMQHPLHALCICVSNILQHTPCMWQHNAAHPLHVGNIMQHPLHVSNIMQHPLHALCICVSNILQHTTC